VTRTVRAAVAAVRCALAMLLAANALAAPAMSGALSKEEQP